MYNRYIPQPDGSYRRSRVGDAPQPPRKPEPIQENPVFTPDPPPVFTAQQRPRPQQRPLPPRPKKQSESTGVLTFLKQLLPRDFDTEDLLIVLLLLLMSGDCREDQNNALLTLAIYLFM